MKVKILQEYGYPYALFGVGLSYGLTSHIDVYTPTALYYDPSWERLKGVAARLAGKDGGHNKFLEFLTVYLDITASRGWWQEFDTYRVGVSRLSESTMHTLGKRPLTEDDFESGDITPAELEAVNRVIDESVQDGKVLDIGHVKRHLPEGFLQRRIVVANYKALRNIYVQRKNHRLRDWHVFCEALEDGLLYPSFITSVQDF